MSDLNKGKAAALFVLTVYLAGNAINLLASFNAFTIIALIFSLVICWFLYLGHPTFLRIMLWMLFIRSATSFFSAYKYPYIGDWVDELLIVGGVIYILTALLLKYFPPVVEFINQQKIKNEHKWLT